MNDRGPDPSEDDPLGPVVESIIAGIRRGERPSPDDYAARHPALARRIHSVFPVIEAMELRAQADPAAATAVPEGGPVQGVPAPFGRYDLLRELGRGGMGLVYQAWDRDARRLVALKVLRPDALEDARFRVESRVLARVEHEFVVPLYEAGEHQGVRYFTMRFIEGGDLARRIEEYAIPSTATRQEADETARRIAALMAKVARAVGHAHRRGVLHRDLKPGNILIGDDGRPLVSDFGLSRRFVADAAAATPADSTSAVPESLPGQAVGTRGYRAPEQAEGGDDLTTAADIFSLGAILYRLLAGKVPFEDGTPTGLVALLDPQREATPPSASNSALVPGSDLEWVCLRCLAKAPAARYPTADALAADLERVAAGEAISRPDRGWPGRLLRVLRRRKRHSNDRAWGQVEWIEAALNFILHAGLFALIRAGATAAACWAWYLAFEAATWWVFLDRLFRGRRTEASEQDLLVLWVGISLAGLALFALYCPPIGAAGSAGLLEFYPPFTVVTGLGLFLAGRIHWGGLYLLGIGFFLLAPALPLAIEFAPLAYGGLLALGLVYTGRVHVRSAGTVERRSNSSR